MTVKNIAKLTLREFLTEKNIKQHETKEISTRTIKNILKGDHYWASCNKNYRWSLPYFPTEKTISKLSLELGITYEELKTLIKNQHKYNKKVAKKEK